MENESLKALLIEKIQSCENIELLTYIASLFENEFENDLIELSDSQKAEIDNRLANLENGEEELFDWEDVKIRLAEKIILRRNEKEKN